jgi:hypothetical protein
VSGVDPNGPPVDPNGPHETCNLSDIPGAVIADRIANVAAGRVMYHLRGASIVFFNSISFK